MDTSRVNLQYSSSVCGTILNSFESSYVTKNQPLFYTPANVSIEAGVNSFSLNPSIGTEIAIKDHNLTTLKDIINSASSPVPTQKSALYNNNPRRI